MDAGQYQSPSPDSLSPERIAHSFLRHKKKATIFVVAVLSLAGLVLGFAPRKYRSESRLFLQVGRESVRLDPTATTGTTIGLQQSGRDSEVATAMEMLRSRAIIEKTVDALTPELVLGEAGVGASAPNPAADVVLAPLRKLVGLVKSIDPISKREEAVIQIERNFEVEAEHDSTLISLTYDAKTAKLAQAVLQKLVEVYRDEHVRLHQTRGSKSFFVEQRSELETQLVAAENAFREAKTAMGVASIEQRRQTLENRLATIEQTRNGVIQSMSSAEARIASLEDQTAAMPEVVKTTTTSIPNTGADTLRSQLYSLQIELMNLEAKYNADHPLVQSTREQVEEAKRMVAEQSDSRQRTETSLNENHRTLSLDLAQAETELAGLRAQLAELDVQRERVQAELLKTNEYEVKLDDLQRELDLAKSNFYASAAKFEQARIDEELDNQRITNVNVAQAATLAEKPVSPSKLILAALSTLMLTAGTTALVLGCEKLDTRLANEDQVEAALGLPVLACVPEGRAYGTFPKARA